MREHRQRWTRLCHCVLAIGIVSSCSPAEIGRPPAPPVIEEANPPAPRLDELEELLRTDAELAAVLDDARRRRVQVLVAIPKENADGKPTLRRLAFRADADYFYPASAVKLCAAAFAIEKLEELRDAASPRELGLTTPLRFITSEGPSRRVVDTTLRSEIERSLVLSDNDAHNHLFEFVGRDELAERMARFGLRSARILHPLGDTTERQPARIELLPGGAPILVAQSVGFELPKSSTTTTLGSAHVDASGHLVQRPMDFSVKNMIPLRELQDLLIAVARPDLVEGALPRIDRDRDELMAILGSLPSELPQFRRSQATAVALDAVYKPVHFAIAQEFPSVRAFGKGGQAYGFSTENTYVIDEATRRSFFVAATIYANDNDVLNDDHYEYESVASPFLTRLGRVLARTLLHLRPA